MAKQQPKPVETFASRLARKQEEQRLEVKAKFEGVDCIHKPSGLTVRVMAVLYAEISHLPVCGCRFPSGAMMCINPDMLTVP
jgi:hypothetical protein